MASSLQLAQTSWQHRLQAAHQPPRPDRQQPIEAPQLASFDLVFTNPPFGSQIKIDAPEILSQFDLAGVWDFDEAKGVWAKRINQKGEVVRQSSQPPEILFIERCIQFLKPGTGRAAIVIPNGILNNPSLGYVRQWLLDHVQVLAVVDMQRDLFQPRNDTQTSMAIFRRLAEDEVKRVPDYPIFFAIAKKIGHDKRGKTIFVHDANGNDVIEEVKTVEKVFEGEHEVELHRIERLPAVDDDLPLIPPLFRKWISKNHAGV